MAEELGALYRSMEERVAERTREIRTASEVARDSATIRDVDQLLDETVRLISSRFGFYHAGIFLVDAVGENAVLRAASSDGGRRMLARGHQLGVGKIGIVGYVTGTGNPRIALDVGADAVHFANPDLPETRSEMALPLRIGERIMGALDVRAPANAFGTTSSPCKRGRTGGRVINRPLIERGPARGAAAHHRHFPADHAGLGLPRWSPRRLP
jgi:putative methionine-R-sulfoxide reductase with GAF domain